MKKLNKFENYNYKNMRKKILLLTIFFIFCISFLTLFLIFNYLDPFRNKMVSIVTLSLTSSLFITTFLTLVLYIFKKAYFRGEIFISHIFSSLRQSFLVNFFLWGIICFYIFGVFSFVTIFLLLLITVFFELLFQNIE